MRIKETDPEINVSFHNTKLMAFEVYITTENKKQLEKIKPILKTVVRLRITIIFVPNCLCFFIILSTVIIVKPNIRKYPMIIEMLGK